MPPWFLLLTLTGFASVANLEECWGKQGTNPGRKERWHGGHRQRVGRSLLGWRAPRFRSLEVRGEESPGEAAASVGDIQFIVF